jgi:hypothetical protein
LAGTVGPETDDLEELLVDVSSTAAAYAAFGGVLVGFAFTGLSFYVTRSSEQDPGGQR